MSSYNFLFYKHSLAYNLLLNCVLNSKFGIEKNNKRLIFWWVNNATLKKLDHQTN